jgi:hypothetical protein
MKNTSSITNPARSQRRRAIAKIMLLVHLLLFSGGFSLGIAWTAMLGHEMERDLAPVPLRAPLHEVAR